MVAVTEMSFPEGSPEGVRSDDQDSSQTEGIFAAVTRPLRNHLETWADRYVAMRIEARR